MLRISLSILISLAFLLLLLSFISSAAVPTPTPWPSPTPWPTPTPVGSGKGEGEGCAFCGPIEIRRGAAFCGDRVGIFRSRELSPTAQYGSFLRFGCQGTPTASFPVSVSWRITHCPYGLWDCPDCPFSCRCSSYSYTVGGLYAAADILNGFEGPSSSILELSAIITIPEGCDAVSYTPYAFEDGFVYRRWWIDCWDIPCQGLPCPGKGAGVFFAGCPGGENCPRGSGFHELRYRFGANYFVGSCDDDCPSSRGGGAAWVEALCTSGPLSGTYLFRGPSGCEATQMISFSFPFSATVVGWADFPPTGLLSSPPVSPILVGIGGFLLGPTGTFPFRYSSLEGDELFEVFVPCPLRLSQLSPFSPITATLVYSECLPLLPSFSLPDLPDRGAGFDFPGVQICLEYYRLGVYLFPFGDVWPLLDRLLVASIVGLLIVFFWRLFTG